MRRDQDGAQIGTRTARAAYEIITFDAGCTDDAGNDVGIGKESV